MRMHNPPHPGEILRELCLEPLGISVTDAAKALGVSRKTLSLGILTLSKITRDSRWPLFGLGVGKW